jgi:tetratricopeptide (TPR) repeat protein
MAYQVSHDSYRQAVAAYQQRQWKRAFELAQHQLTLQSDHAPSCYIAGLAALELHDWPKALTHLQMSSRLEPENIDHAVQWAKALTVANMSGDALRVANHAMSLGPRDALTLDTLGVVYSRCQAHERAAKVFRRAASLAPEMAAFRYNYATALMYAGSMDEAGVELEAAIALNPQYWLAHFMLSRLRPQTTELNHIPRLRALLDRDALDATGRMYLHMALGKELEDLGDYAAAFDHYAQGKRATRRAHGVLAQHDKAVVEALIAACPKAGAAGDGCATDEPIFVLGLPRSGTTLVERILSSHPYVYSAGELPNFGMTLKRMTGTSTPFALDVPTIERALSLPMRELGAAYLGSTRPLTSAKPHFIDKLPHNFLYIGFIANALPNARIVCLRRHPLDTCLSNFREQFAEASEFHDYSLDLMDTARYYVLFDRLMAHWQQVFPGRILEVHYESLVSEQEAISRQIVEHCRLPWHDACLRFEANAAPVTTASAVQVRSPMNNGSIARWKKYDAQLAEVKAFLVEQGIDCS